MRTRLLGLLALLCLLIVGCGYHTPDSASEWAGGEARLLYVELFENKTAQPYLEGYVTDAVTFELAKSRLLEITEQPQRAEVKLVGDVTDFSSRALAHGVDDRIVEYRAQMTIVARLVAVSDNQVLWQHSLTRNEDYPATEDKNLQLEAEALVAKRVARRLAEDLYASLLTGF
ncbi:MAG: LPS assembly lipoprotein LptE [Desulfuromonadales bacterium]|nr:LPS assembly lipoprotein LptE [Desulfuromonadales bacterium]